MTEKLQSSVTSMGQGIGGRLPTKESIKWIVEVIQTIRLVILNNKAQMMMLQVELTRCHIRNQPPTQNYKKKDTMNFSITQIPVKHSNILDHWFCSK